MCPMKMVRTPILTHPDFARMQLWLQDDPKALPTQEIWGAFYKKGGNQGISDFVSWQDDLNGKLAAKDANVKRSHKKKKEAE